jgi:hypothetical protein
VDFTYTYRSVAVRNCGKYKVDFTYTYRSVAVRNCGKYEVDFTYTYRSVAVRNSGQYEVDIVTSIVANMILTLMQALRGKVTSMRWIVLRV